MSIMTSSAPSSESYETCLSEFTQSGSGSLVGISQSESTIGGGLIQNGETVNSESQTSQIVFGEELKQVDVDHHHFEVLPDSPTLGTVDGEVLGEVVSPLGHVHSYYSDPESDQEFDEDDDKDTYALANRIRLLIQTLASRSRSMPGVESSFLPQISERIVRDSVTGQPMPFADAAFLSDTELIAKLKNTLTMNGVKVAPTCGKRKGLTVSMTEVEKKSVWAILDSFKAPPAHHWCADLPEHLTPIGGADGLDTLHTDSSPTTVISDDSSIMMCFPLVPVPDSKVELTKFSVVTITQIGSDRPKMKKLLKKYRMFVTFGNKVDNKNVENSRSWKFWKKKGTSPQGVSSVLEPNVVTPEGQPTFTSKSLTSLASHSNLSSKADVKQRVWVPSTTNMSVQALWWGYRIFLPPPVLSILSDDEVEATKRVALITTALTWFFNNIPVAALPLPMQPAVFMLQKLCPYLGYIGTFISWGWDSIRNFDTGHGVILSATWLLPVALIPGTWESYDFPVQPEEPVEDQPSSTVSVIEQDPKLDLALRLPLPPSSTSLSSAAIPSSRCALSALPSAPSTADSVAPVATPRLSPVPILPSATSVAAPSLVTATRSSTSQVSFTTASSRSDRSTSVSPSASTDSRMITHSSFSSTSGRGDGLPEFLTEGPQRPPRSEKRTSPPSSITLSPTTIHAATTAAEMLQILNESEYDARHGERQGRAEEMKDPEVNNAQQANFEDKNGDTERKNVEANISSAHISESSTDEPISPHGKTPITDNKADVAGNESQTFGRPQSQPSSPVKGFKPQARATNAQNESKTQVDGDDAEKAIQPSYSTRTVKTQKENIPPSPNSPSFFINRTPTKTKMTSSSSADGGSGNLHTQLETKKGVISDKKEKRKSRGMAVVGGLWKLLTGSSN